MLAQADGLAPILREWRNADLLEGAGRPTMRKRPTAANCISLEFRANLRGGIA
jgi:hypothetical protein